TFRRKFMLIILGPAMEIVGSCENKRRHRRCSRGARLLRIHWDAPDRDCREKLNDANFHKQCAHAVAGGGGIGGGTRTANRFCQLARWRIRKISQPTNANRPAGRVTNMNQPITPSE